MTKPQDELYDMFGPPLTSGLQKARTGALEDIAKREKRHRISKLVTGGLWIYLVLLSTIFLVIGGMHAETLKGIYFTALACFWLLSGAVYLGRLWVDRLRLDIERQNKLRSLEQAEIIARLERLERQQRP